MNSLYKFGGGGEGKLWELNGKGSERNQISFFIVSKPERRREQHQCFYWWSQISVFSLGEANA